MNINKNIKHLFAITCLDVNIKTGVSFICFCFRFVFCFLNTYGDFTGNLAIML